MSEEEDVEAIFQDNPKVADSLLYRLRLWLLLAAIMLIIIGSFVWLSG